MLKSEEALKINFVYHQLKHYFEALFDGYFKKERESMTNRENGHLCRNKRMHAYVQMQTIIINYNYV